MLFNFFISFSGPPNYLYVSISLRALLIYVRGAVIARPWSPTKCLKRLRQLTRVRIPKSFKDSGATDDDDNKEIIKLVISIHLDSSFPLKATSVFIIRISRMKLFHCKV